MGVRKMEGHVIRYFADDYGSSRYHWQSAVILFSATWRKPIFGTLWSVT